MEIFSFVNIVKKATAKMDDRNIRCEAKQCTHVWSQTVEKMTTDRSYCDTWIVPSDTRGSSRYVTA